MACVVCSDGCGCDLAGHNEYEGMKGNRMKENSFEGLWESKLLGNRTYTTMGPLLLRTYTTKVYYKAGLARVLHILCKQHYRPHTSTSSPIYIAKHCSKINTQLDAATLLSLHRATKYI